MRQFEPDGEYFLYRRRLAGRGVRISPEERYDFIRKFESGGFWMTFAMVPLFLLLNIVFVIIDVFLFSEEHIDFVITTASILTAACWIALRRQHWGAVATKLAGRPWVGIDRTRQQARQMRFAQTGWSFMLTSGVLFGYAVATIWQNEDIWHGSGRLWLPLLAVVVAGYALWAVLKLRAIRLSAG